MAHVLKSSGTRDVPAVTATTTISRTVIPGAP